MIKPILAVFAVSLSALWAGACSHAQLLPEAPTDAARAEGQDLLRNLIPHLPNCPGTLAVTGQDRWSNWLWRLTPLATQQATFEFRADGERIRLRLPAQDLELLWEAGAMRKKKGAAQSWSPHASWLDRIYLESLALYLRLPLLVARGHHLAATGPNPFEPRHDQGLYFTLDPGDDPDLDQFLAYFPRATPRIEALRFTYRDLSRSYTGWLRWHDQRGTPFGTYPFHISVQKSYDAPRDDHALILTSVACETTAP